MRPSTEAEVQPIETERLRLVWMSPAFIELSLTARRREAEQLLGGRLPESWPDEHARRVLDRRREQMKRRPETGEWLLRAMVRREDGRCIGYINFHGPPAEGRAELGYTVFEEHRRRGYASEAALGMMGWAHDCHGVRRFVVSISPSNAPSLAMAAKLGFERTGSQFDDEDGEEWVFELIWPAPAGPAA